MYRRRGLLRAIGGAGVGVLAGCASGGDRERLERPREDADVIAGPDGRWVFDPEELTVTAGETVMWFFDSHGPDRSPGTTEARGGVYEHALEGTGTYVYVCSTSAGA